MGVFDELADEDLEIWVDLLKYRSALITKIRGNGGHLSTNLYSPTTRYLITTRHNTVVAAQYGRSREKIMLMESWVDRCLAAGRVLGEKDDWGGCKIGGSYGEPEGVEAPRASKGKGKEKAWDRSISRDDGTPRHTPQKRSYSPGVEKQMFKRQRERSSESRRMGRPTPLETPPGDSASAASGSMRVVDGVVGDAGAAVHPLAGEHVRMGASIARKGNAAEDDDGMESDGIEQDYDEDIEMESSSESEYEEAEEGEYEEEEVEEEEEEPHQPVNAVASSSRLHPRDFTGMDVDYEILPARASIADQLEIPQAVRDGLEEMDPELELMLEEKAEAEAMAAATRRPKTTTASNPTPTTVPFRRKKNSIGLFTLWEEIEMARYMVNHPEIPQLLFVTHTPWVAHAKEQGSIRPSASYHTHLQLRVPKITQMMADIQAGMDPAARYGLTSKELVLLKKGEPKERKKKALLDAPKPPRAPNWTFAEEIDVVRYMLEHPHNSANGSVKDYWQRFLDTHPQSHRNLNALQTLVSPSCCIYRRQVRIREQLEKGEEPMIDMAEWEKKGPKQLDHYLSGYPPAWDIPSAPTVARPETLRRNIIYDHPEKPTGVAKIPKWTLAEETDLAKWMLKNERGEQTAHAYFSAFRSSHPHIFRSATAIGSNVSHNAAFIRRFKRIQHQIKNDLEIAIDPSEWEGLPERNLAKYLGGYPTAAEFGIAGSAAQSSPAGLSRAIARSTAISSRPPQSSPRAEPRPYPPQSSLRTIPNTPRTTNIGKPSPPRYTLAEEIDMVRYQLEQPIGSRSHHQYWTQFLELHPRIKRSIGSIQLYNTLANNSAQRLARIRKLLAEGKEVVPDPEEWEGKSAQLEKYIGGYPGEAPSAQHRQTLPALAASVVNEPSSVLAIALQRTVGSGERSTTAQTSTVGASAASSSTLPADPRQMARYPSPCTRDQAASDSDLTELDNPDEEDDSSRKAPRQSSERGPRYTFAEEVDIAKYMIEHPQGSEGALDYWTRFVQTHPHMHRTAVSLRSAVISRPGRGIHAAIMRIKHQLENGDEPTPDVSAWVRGRKLARYLGGYPDAWDQPRPAAEDLQSSVPKSQSTSGASKSGGKRSRFTFAEEVDIARFMLDNEGANESVDQYWTRFLKCHPQINRTSRKFAAYNYTGSPGTARVKRIQEQLEKGEEPSVDPRDWEHKQGLLAAYLSGYPESNRDEGSRAVTPIFEDTKPTITSPSPGPVTSPPPSSSETPRVLATKAPRYTFAEEIAMVRFYKDQKRLENESTTAYWQRFLDTHPHIYRTASTVANLFCPGASGAARRQRILDQLMAGKEPVIDPRDWEGKKPKHLKAYLSGFPEPWEGAEVRVKAPPLEKEMEAMVGYIASHTGLGLLDFRTPVMWDNFPRPSGTTRSSRDYADHVLSNLEFFRGKLVPISKRTFGPSASSSSAIASSSQPKVKVETPSRPAPAPASTPSTPVAPESLVQYSEEEEEHMARYMARNVAEGQGLGGTAIWEVYSKNNPRSKNAYYVYVRAHKDKFEELVEAAREEMREEEEAAARMKRGEGGE